MKRNRRATTSLIAVLCLGAAVFAFSGRILWGLGAWLTNAEPPQKADIVVVIGGDHHGNRILKGAELVREGFAPKVLSSGVASMYGVREADMAIDFAVQHGYPRDIFISSPYPALSTLDEARGLEPQLRRLGVHKYLVVTSPWHTARTERVFRRVTPDLDVHTVESPDRDWENGEWWKNREGRKLWFYEALKTTADFFGI